MTKSPLCGCVKMQTVRHIVNECPITKYKGGFDEIYSASDYSIKWTDNLGMCL